MMIHDRARAFDGVEDYFRYSGRVRFQTVAWELHRLEPVPDFRINEVNYSLGPHHASELVGPSLPRVLLKLSDDRETADRTLLTDDLDRRSP